MKPSLHVVEPADPSVVPVAERVRRLQAEARALAVQHVADLIRKTEECSTVAGEIANGGEAYPVGIREIAQRIAEEAEARVQTLNVLLSRLA